MTQQHFQRWLLKHEVSEAKEFFMIDECFVHNFLPPLENTSSTCFTTTLLPAPGSLYHQNHEDQLPDASLAEGPHQHGLQGIIEVN